MKKGRKVGHTFFRTLESHVELLHIVVHERNFVVAHQPRRSLALAASTSGNRRRGNNTHLHDVHLYPTLRAAHLAGSPRTAGFAKLVRNG
jgi:hypothetical protein